MTLTLSASAFKPSALRSRLPSKQLHSAEHTMHCVRKPSWHRLEDSSEDEEPKRPSWQSRRDVHSTETPEEDKTSLFLPQQNLRLHDCHSELTLLSWLWRSPRIFLSSVYLRFSRRAEKDLSGATSAEEPRDRGVCEDESSASWCLIHTTLAQLNPRGETVPVVDVLLACFLNEKNKIKNCLVGLFH